MLVMRKTPCEKVERRSRDELHSQGYPWDKRETPGTRGRKHRSHPSRSLRATHLGLACLKPPLGMEIAGEALVPASPPGPSHNQRHTAGSRPDQASKQMPDFRNGQGKPGACAERRSRESSH